MIIQGKNIVLKNFEEQHITNEYITTLNDKKLTKYSLLSLKKHDKNSCVNYIKDIKLGKSLLLGIFLKNSNQSHLGNITISFYEFNNSADLGVILLKNYHGKGYASESFEIVFNYLFNICKIRKVTIGTCVGNKKMTNLALKVGMVRDGIRKKHYVLGNIEHDVIHFAKYKC